MGPSGMGTRSGRGMGYCVGSDRPGYLNPGFSGGQDRFYSPIRGAGRGGRPWGGGRGRVWGGGRGSGWSSPYHLQESIEYYHPNYPYHEPYSKNQEAAELKQEADYLRKALSEIEKRLDELEKQKDDI